MNFFRRTFARAGAFAFLGEAGAHVWVLTHKHFTLEQLPLWADWFFFLVGGYSAVGLWLNIHYLRVRNCRTYFWYLFVTLFLSVTVLLHAYILAFDHQHTILHIFPRWYSWIGLAYCLAYAWTLVRIRVLPREE
jgi:hypothetical protein